MFRLKELRLENGLTRSELGSRLNVHPNTIANYENELREAPYALLIRLAEFFDVSVDYLLGIEGDKAAGPRNAHILSKAEKELIARYRDSSDLGRSRILEFARLWSDIKQQ